jgi:hypothetical protein
VVHSPTKTKLFLVKDGLRCGLPTQLLDLQRLEKESDATSRPRTDDAL